MTLTETPAIAGTLASLKALQIDTTIFNAHVRGVERDYAKRLAQALEAGETLPPILVARPARANGHYRLVDGQQRIAAALMRGASLDTAEEDVEILCVVVDADLPKPFPEVEILKLAAMANTAHGLPLTQGQIQTLALRLFERHVDEREIAVVLRYPVGKVRSWTEYVVQYPSNHEPSAPPAAVKPGMKPGVPLQPTRPQEAIMRSLSIPNGPRAVLDLKAMIEADLLPLDYHSFALRLREFLPVAVGWLKLYDAKNPPAVSDLSPSPPDGGTPAEVVEQPKVEGDPKPDRLKVA